MSTRLLASAAILLAVSTAAAAQAIRLHPDNPRWPEWRGNATALITSAEHYAVIRSPSSRRATNRSRSSMT